MFSRYMSPYKSAPVNYLRSYNSEYNKKFFFYFSKLLDM